MRRFFSSKKRLPGLRDGNQPGRDGSRVVCIAAALHFTEVIEGAHEQRPSADARISASRESVAPTTSVQGLSQLAVPVTSQRKTGPLCSRHLHKGPARLYCSDILSARDAGCFVAKRNDLRLSESYEVFVERLLLFLLGCLLCLLCLLRFLGHVALR